MYTIYLILLPLGRARRRAAPYKPQGLDDMHALRDDMHDPSRDDMQRRRLR